MNTFSKLIAITTVATVTSLIGCKPRGAQSAVGGDAAQKTYVAPGKYDEFYDFVSGGFSGQMSVYGLPSGRLLKVIPVFSQDPQEGYGYSEETKGMLNTSHGFIPWDDLHHISLSMTNGEHGTGYEGDAETQCIFYLIENALLEIGSDGGVDERDFVSSSQQGRRDREDSKRCGCLSACEGWEEEDNFA